MSKHDRISAFIASLSKSDNPEIHPCYAGFFECFNRCEYYEAHDVLEHLWLNCQDDNYRFFKGLIQIAGAFVHLKKHRARPHHPTDGRRLHPAARLLALGESNISPYAPRHMGLDVEIAWTLCTDWRLKIISSEYRINPWNPDLAPRLEIESARPQA